MDGTTIYERVPGFEVSETADGYVLYREGDEGVHFLNASAAAILEFCDGERDVNEIVRLVSTGYSQGPEMRAEIEECVSMFESSNILVKRP